MKVKNRCRSGPRRVCACQLVTLVTMPGTARYPGQDWTAHHSPAWKKLEIQPRYGSSRMRLPPHNCELRKGGVRARLHRGPWKAPTWRQRVTDPDKLPPVEGGPFQDGEEGATVSSQGVSLSHVGKAVVCSACSVP